MRTRHRKFESARALSNSSLRKIRLPEFSQSEFEKKSVIFEKKSVIFEKKMAWIPGLVVQSGGLYTKLDVNGSLGPASSPGRPSDGSAT